MGKKILPKREHKKWALDRNVEKSGASKFHTCKEMCIHHEDLTGIFFSFEICKISRVSAKFGLFLILGLLLCNLYMVLFYFIHIFR